jgi:hypothetical protein
MFHENWYSIHQCMLLAQKAAEVLSLEGLIIEIGSWEGRSANYKNAPSKAGAWWNSLRR